MNIYRRELRAHRKSLIIWSVSMFLLIAAAMTKYSAALGAGAGGFNEIMAQMPKSLQGLFGVGVFDLSNVLDYFGVMFIYIALMAGVHAAMLGAGILSKEERDKTVEFLMVKPVSRTQIITAKLLAATTIVIVFNLVTSVSSYDLLSKYSTGDPYFQGLTKLMLSLFAVQLLFLVIGSAFAAMISNAKLSSAVSTGVLLMMFMISVMVDISEKVQFLRFVSIFKYFDAKVILKGTYDFVYPVISAGILLLCLYWTYRCYKRRDLKI